MHSFQTVADIRIEPGGAAKLDYYVEGLCRNKRVTIVTDKGVKNLGLMDAGIAALKAAGYAVFVFDRLLMNNAREMTYDATVKIYETIL